MAMLLSEANCI